MSRKRRRVRVIGPPTKERLDWGDTPTELAWKLQIPSFAKAFAKRAQREGQPLVEEKKGG